MPPTAPPASPAATADPAAFVARWQTSDASERANYQLFLSELCDVLAVPRPDPARNADRIAEFGRVHVDAALALTAWRQTVTAATRRSPAEVRRTYGSADPAVLVDSGRRVAVFNIKGNKYRLVAAIDYKAGIVNVLRVMTHAQYSRDRWKDVL